MHEPGKNVGPSRGEWDTHFNDADLDSLLAGLKAPEEVSPRAGFYARVMDRIETQRGKSIWSVFLEPLFGRRLALASAILMVLLGAALYVPGSGFDDEVLAKSDPLVIDESLTASAGGDRVKDAVLANLVTYQEH